jgi:hypothetical protein
MWRFRVSPQWCWQQTRAPYWFFVKMAIGIPGYYIHHGYPEFPLSSLPYNKYIISNL